MYLPGVQRVFELPEWSSWYTPHALAFRFKLFAALGASSTSMISQVVTSRMRH